MKAWLALLLALLALAGCSEPSALPLRVGLNPWVGYDPLVLARERRLLDPAQVRVVELLSNTETQRALRNGQIDGAAMTLDEALRLADEGVALKIVAVLDISSGAGAVLVVSADAWVKRRDPVLELLVGWERGRRALLADPPSAAALLASGVDLTPAQYLATLEGLQLQTLADSVHWLAGQPAPLAQYAEGLARTLQRLGLIRHPPDWPALLDGRSAAAAQSRLVKSP